MEKENSLQSLTLVEHIRLRPQMYIGKLGHGIEEDDGIYTLLKILVDNSVDEFRAGYGKRIEISWDLVDVSVRDYGRGLPFDSIVPLVTHTGHQGMQSESSARCKSVGLNGIGLCTVMALSQDFRIISYRGGKRAEHHFVRGWEVDSKISETSEPDGLMVTFVPDRSIFGVSCLFKDSLIEPIARLYAQLNKGLEVSSEEYYSRNSYLCQDGLRERLEDIQRYCSASEPFHLVGKDVEIAFLAGTPCTRIESYVNGHRTKAGGPHQDALMEAFSDHFGAENFVAVMNIMLEKPEFADQARNELSSRYMWERYNEDGKRVHGESIRTYLKKFISKELNKKQKNNG